MCAISWPLPASALEPSYLLLLLPLLTMPPCRMGPAGSAAAAALPLPAPLQFPALPGLLRHLLEAARLYMASMADELMHLRAYLRFSTPRQQQQGQQGAELPRPGSAEGGGVDAAVRALSQALGMWAGPAGVEDAEEEAPAVPSPKLLISGQWRAKHEVLLLAAQLREVEQAHAQTTQQLRQAERWGGRSAACEAGAWWLPP